MKFNCGMSREEKNRLAHQRYMAKLNLLREWHQWFAWFPVRVGPRDCRWLEKVDRRMYTTGFFSGCPVFEYAPKYRGRVS